MQQLDLGTTVEHQVHARLIASVSKWFMSDGHSDFTQADATSPRKRGVHATIESDPIVCSITLPQIEMGDASGTCMWSGDSPRVDGHALEYLLACASYDDEVPDMVVVRELLEAWDVLVHGRDIVELMEWHVYRLLHVRMFLRVVYEFLEDGCDFVRALRFGEVVRVDGLNWLGLDSFRRDVRHDWMLMVNVWEQSGLI